MCSYFLAVSHAVLSKDLWGSWYRILCPRSEAAGVFDMEPFRSQGDQQRTLLTKRKHRIDMTVCCPAETAEQKEHRLSESRTKEQAVLQVQLLR